MRSAVLVLLLASCSSESVAPLDLAAGPPDLAAVPPACMFVFSGDGPGMEPRCEILFCRLSMSESLLRLYGVTGRTEVDFVVDGQFAAGRGYTAADLKSFGAFSEDIAATVSYEAGNQVVGSTATLTLTDVSPALDSCPLTGSGTVHGTAHVGLVESLTDDGGAASPRHETIDAAF